MPSTTNSTTSLDALSTLIPPHFQEAQLTLANHRKNTVALFKLHARAAVHVESTSRGLRLVGEKAFNEAFLACLNRVLGVKKGVVNADRAIKFAATYSAYAQTTFRASAREAAKAVDADEVEAEDDEEDTPGTRFVSILIKHLLRGFGAKNKAVRLRCTQGVALLINGLEAMDDDLYHTLRGALLMRARDRESSVRVQAIVALAKLQSGDDDEEDAAGGAQSEGEGSEASGASAKDITSVLLEILRHDPSAEVRRAALFNLTPTARTLPFILERLRDVDAINRRCVYLGSLSSSMLTQPGATTPEVQEWADVVRTGLGEREESVKRAARKLITGWMDRDVELSKFITRFDCVNTPEVAASALQCIFEARPALLDTVAFNEDFWATLSPGTALIARQFVEFTRAQGASGAARLEETMPLVTALAFRTQAAWGALLELLEGEYEEDPSAPLSAPALSRQAILGSLLHIAMAADYGDEIGRRKMFGLVRDMIASALFPHALVEGALDVLLKLSAGQRDFMQIVVELVQEMGDWEREGEEEEDEEDEESQVESQLNSAPNGGKKAAADPAEVARVDARRLAIVRGMLERISGGGIREMMGLVSQLISPAMRSHDEGVREQGFLCMGLCALLDAELATTTFPMFLNHVQKSAGIIKVRAMQVIFDVLLVHGIARLSKAQVAALGGGAEAQRLAHEHLVTFLLGLLEDDDEDLRVQASAAQGVAKLMLAGIVVDDVALRSLVLIYMTPETVHNQELRQCLGYFLPAYCGSSAENQRALQRVLADTLQILTELYYELEDGQEMVTPLQIGLQLLDWTDPAKAMRQGVDDAIHVDVGMDLLKRLALADEKDERKVLCQLLGKLNLPEELDEQRAVALFALAAKLKEANPFAETVTRNAFARFETALAKRYPEAAAVVAQGVDLAAEDAAPVLKELAEWITEVGFTAGVVTSEAAPVAKARTAGAAKGKRAAPKPTAAKKSKKQQQEESEVESSEQEEEEEEEDEADDDDEDD